MNKDDFAIPSKDIYCYGYLDKGKDEDRKTYYDLFRRAKIFINTTPKWGAFSATIEAMYFYTPVIVAPYNEFVKTFGGDIQFGAYCDQNLPDEIEKNIRSILNNSSYSNSPDSFESPTAECGFEPPRRGQMLTVECGVQPLPRKLSGLLL